jgi:TBCC domain-containing protein 1
MGSGNTNLTDRQLPFDKKKFAAASSAKELPVWLVSTFLLLHCEEIAYQRNLSGMDDRRFYGNSAGTDAFAKNVDFASLWKHPGLSPR